MAWAGGPEDPLTDSCVVYFSGSGGFYLQTGFAYAIMGQLNHETEVCTLSSYEFSLRQEVLLEMGADILGDIVRFGRKNNISPLDSANPINVMYGLVWNVKRQILCAETEKELDQIRLQFEFAQRFSAGIEV